MSTNNLTIRVIFAKGMFLMFVAMNQKASGKSLEALKDDVRQKYSGDVQIEYLTAIDIYESNK